MERVQTALHHAAALLQRTRGDDDARHRRGGADISVSNFVSYIVAAVAVIVVIVLLAKLFYANLRRHPPLLTRPIQGDVFVPYPHYPTFPATRRPPAVERQDRPDGLALPYAKNNLAFLPPRVPMPDHSVQNRMSVTLWIKPDNIAQPYTEEGGEREQPAYLMAMNYSSTPTRGNAGEAPIDPTNLAIMYSAMHNELILRLRIVEMDGQKMQEFHLPQVLTQQRWQMLTLVIDNRNIDIYKDGKLQRSFLLANVPLLGYNTWSLFPGEVPFVGTVTCVRFYGYALNHHEVKRIYRRQHSKNDVPSMSFLTWWTWVPSTPLTRLLYP